MTDLIRQMGYVVVTTPHVAACAADIADILGLHTTLSNETSVLMSSNARQCEVAYIQAPAPGIRAVGCELRAPADDCPRRSPRHR